MTPRPRVPQRLYDIAVARAIADSRSSAVNFGQSLGEARESLRFISSSVKKALKVIIALKRGNFSRAAYELDIKRRKGVADNYLAYIFGLKPLANDIMNGLTELRKAVNRRDFISVKGGIVESLPKPFTPNWGLSGDVKGGASCGLNFELVNSADAAFDYLMLNNPLATAWELLPSSYIVNWFVGVTQFLNQFSLNTGLRFTGGYVTTFTKGTYEAQSKGSYPGTSYTIRIDTMERDVLLHVPLTGLHMSWNFDFSKLVTLGALASSRGVR
jgi:hypothetical protein